MQKTCISKVSTYAVKKRQPSSALVPEMPTDIVINDPDYNVEPFSEHDLKVLKDNINNQLAADITHNDIAEHCGNSVQVIEAHYQKARVKNKAPAHIAGNIVDYNESLGAGEGIERLRQQGLVYP